MNRYDRGPLNSIPPGQRPAAVSDAEIAASTRLPHALSRLETTIASLKAAAPWDPHGGLTCEVRQALVLSTYEVVTLLAILDACRTPQ